MLGTDPEEIGPFTDSFITYIVLVWDKKVAIFQGYEAWTYLKPDKNNCNGRLRFRLIYNHYLGPSNIYHMAAGAEKKLVQYSYTEEKRNWSFETYTTLHKEQNNII